MKGFTLVEILIVTAIFLIVGTVLAGILVNNTGIYNSQSSLVTSGLNTNDAIHEIENFTRQASSVVSGYPDVSPTYISNSTTLVLKVPAFNALGVIANTYDYVVFTKDNAKTNLLWEYIFPDALSDRSSQNRVLSSILQSVEFIYLDKNDNIVTATSAEKVKTQITVLPGSNVSDKSRSSIIVTNLRNI
ncbi:MAG: type II secretion system protein [Candidatus Daviesbacteria bacterium]|nr:type II secretion system protein [Candidatus Daviesbacteria bacterium]